MVKRTVKLPILLWVDVEIEDAEDDQQAKVLAWDEVTIEQIREAVDSWEDALKYDPFVDTTDKA